MTLTPGGPVDRLPRGSPARRRPRRQLPVLVSQNFFRHGDRYREENGETARQVRHRRVRHPHRLRLPGRRHQPDLVAAEARRAAADSRRRDPGRQRPGTRKTRARSTSSRTARRRSTTSSTSRRPASSRTSRSTSRKNEQLVAAAAAGHVQRGRQADQDRHASRGTTSRSTARPTTCSAFLQPRERPRPEPRQDRLPHAGRERSSRRSSTLLDAAARLQHDALVVRRCCTTTSPAAREFLLHADHFVTECGGPTRQPAADDRSGRPRTSTSTWSTSRWSTPAPTPSASGGRSSTTASTRSTTGS